MARGTKNRPGTPKEKAEAATAALIPPSIAAAQIIAVADPEVEEEMQQEVETEEETPAEPRLTVTQRCEEAKETSCSCRCRGKYHAKPHPQGWKDEAGCEPLTKEERKVAKREALKQWRRAHPDRVSAYMKGWFATSAAPTAQAVRYAHDQKINKQIAKGVTETEDETGA